MRRVEALDRDLTKVLVNHECDAHAAADNRSPAPLHNDLELRSPAPQDDADRAFTLEERLSFALWQ